MSRLIKSATQEEVAQALTGADYVREQLLAALGMGPNNLYKKVYAIKCRIKDEKRFIEKIEKKCIAKPNYKASDVTDVVGLKIVCIFAEQLPDTVKELIAFLEFCQTPYIGLLSPKGISDSINEVIVYFTKEQEENYRIAYDYLASLNLGHSAAGKQKLEIREATQLNPYSSIHLVVLANSHYASSVRRIPVEIQVRTAFEDIWAEIDHPRRYKGPDFESMYADDPAKARIARGIANRMKRLKSELDVASGNASDIKVDFDTLTEESSIVRRSAAASTKRVGTRQMCSAGAPGEIRERLVELENKLNEVMPGGVLIGLGVKSLVSSSDVNEIKSRLTNLSKELDETKKNYEERWQDVYESDKAFLYYSGMESAYIYYLLSRLESSSSEFDARLFNTYYKSALRNYFHVLENNPYENDSLIYFRIGSSYVLGGQIDLAVQSYRKATNVLVDDALFPSDSIYRSMIPRHTGYVLWVQADQLIKEGERDDNFHLKSQAAELIKDALEITFGWYRRLKEAHHPALMGATEELLSYHNNILYYSAKYVELRSLESLERDCKIDKATIDTLYNSFSISDEMALNRVDTMVNVGLSLGKDAEAKLWAEKLRSGLDNPVIAAMFSKQQLELMHESVKKALGDEARPFGGEAMKYPDP